MEELIIKKPQKVDIICSKKKLLMYNDDKELLLYKKRCKIEIPGTRLDDDESLEQAVYRLTGIQINSNSLVELIRVKEYIKENHPINGKLRFLNKEINREYYSYYLGDSRIYPYEITELGEFVKIPLEKLIQHPIYYRYLPAYEELDKRLTYQKY